MQNGIFKFYILNCGLDRAGASPSPSNCTNLLSTVVRIFAMRAAHCGAGFTLKWFFECGKKYVGVLLVGVAGHVGGRPACGLEQRHEDHHVGQVLSGGAPVD